MTDPTTSAIRALQARIGEINTANGWRDKPPPAGFETTHDIAVLALIGTEVSEAIEELRNGRGLAAYHGPLFHGQSLRKPEGVPSELADIVIRALDFADARGIDLAAAIEEKLAYNASRGHRHGEKTL